jgi:hypothetical protein
MYGKLSEIQGMKSLKDISKKQQDNLSWNSALQISNTQQENFSDFLRIYNLKPTKQFSTLSMEIK